MWSIRVQRWSSGEHASEAGVKELLAAEGLAGHRWSNGPGDTYSAHDHSYHKVIYVVDGSITFVLPDIGEEIVLVSGDRLDLPAGTVHAAVVGKGGVVCLEAHSTRRS